MERFEFIKNDVNYINYCNMKDRIIDELKGDNWDAEHLKFMIWYLNERRYELDTLNERKYTVENSTVKEVNE